MALSTGFSDPSSAVNLPLPSADLTLPPQASPAPANAQSPSADPLAGVMARIAQPESGGRNVLYGGAPVPPGNVIPGAIGPTGQQTHAFTKYQFEPPTWNEIAAVARSQGRTPNKDDPNYVEWAGRYLATKTYHEKTGRDLASDARAGNVDYSALAGQWPSLAKGAPGFPDSTQANKVREAKYAEAADLDKAAQAAIKQIGEMGGDISKAMERVRAAQDKAEEAQRASLAAISKAPKQPELDAVQHLGSLATVVGILGGLFTHAPMRASINGMASALEAYNSGDQRAYQQAYNNWKTQTDMLFKVAEMNAQNVRQILYDEDMGLNERKAMLDATLRASGLSQLADAARTQGEGVVLDWQEKMAAAHQQYQKYLDTLENTQAWRQARLQMERDRLDLQSSKQNSTGLLNQYGDPPDKLSDNPNKPTPGSNIPASVWDGATQLALTGHMPVLGNSAAGRAAIQSALPWVLAARGMTASDMTQQGIAYGGAVAGERTLATRLANLTVGLSEVPHLGEQLIEVSNATPRTESLDVNRLLQAYETRTGDPQIIKLGAALNSYLQSYARAINPTGVISDDMRRHADDVLNQAMSKGQIQAGVDQLNKELVAMRQGLNDAAQTGKQMFPLPGEKPPAGVLPQLFHEFTGQGGGGATKYSVGQIIPTPKGKYRVTGGDLNGDPDVEPVH